MQARWIAVALALVAASAFALSVEDGHWWSIGEVSIGPFGTRHCFGGDCRSSGLSWTGGSELWMRSAIATGVAGIVAMLAFIWLAARVAAKRVPRLVAQMSLVAIATAVACGAYFYASAPSIVGAAIDRGIWLFVAAVAFGIAAAITVLRAPR